MTDHEIELKLKKAVESHTPDVLENILSQCDTQKGKVIVMKKKNMFKMYASIAAALVVVLGITAFGLSRFGSTADVASTVLFDINPSIELQIDEGKEVLQANALNDDAKAILEGMKLKGTDVNTATNAIVGSLLKHGYIDELANSILVSVEDKNAERGAKLQTEITKEINDILAATSINASVLSQYVADDVDSVSQKYQISHGKAALIESILAVNDTYKEEDLAKLSVNELNLLLSNPVNKTDKVTTSGTASEKSYIGKDKAKAAALAHANVKEADIFDYEIEFDFDDGKMLYEIEFSSGIYDYDYDIDALAGTVVKSNKEVDDDRSAAQNANQNSSSNNTTNTNKSNTSNNTSNNTGNKTNNTTSSTTDIGKEKAKSIAFNHAGTSASKVTNLEVEKERDDGRLEYHIEFRVGTTKYEYDINAANGKIVDYERDVEDDLFDDDYYDDDDDD